MTERQEHILFELTDVQLLVPFQFKSPINLKMTTNEQWIVYGPNGSGKTFLVKAITSSYPFKQGKISYDFSPVASTKISENILYVTFHDQYGDQGGQSFYQLRWNQGLIDSTIPKVKDIFDTKKVKNLTLLNILEQKLKIGDLLDKYVISLSSGEFRRFQIAKIILQNPRLLIIKNPFIGLDEENREQVTMFLQEIIKTLPIQLILIVSRLPQDITAFTHLVQVKDGNIQKLPIEKGNNFANLEPKQLPPPKILELSNCFQSHPTVQTEKKEQSSSILELHNITIKYGERTILKNLNWNVNRGEKWALQGENGAGKSTLLSIVCADNPQSYSCDVTLFGFHRGSGESIWDIKKHIGFVSPEIYRSYRKPLPVENIIASGLYDTIGLFKKPKETDFQKIEFWMNIFGLSNYKKRNYMQLSNGEQRLILLVRAFVKNPDLIILDEPFHGIDATNRLLAKQIIQSFCSQPDKTLIMVSHYKEDFPSCITHTMVLQKN